jgi:choline dehydrogenase-like flavoprotein
MFIDARRIASNQTLETDICIIGAGAAGITLAHEFAGKAVRVAVLESGGLDFDADTRDLSVGQDIGRPYFPLDVAQLRFFGGTTNHWGGLCRPFNALDFESRPWVPHSGWPFGKTELDPYYERARVVCNLHSAEWSADYWLRRDRFPALPFVGNRLVTRIVPVVSSAERRFAPNYRKELEQAANLSIYLYANLTELETNEAGRTVTEANVACLTGNRFKVRAKQFILAASGIENPRLLLLSKRRQPAGLGNQHDQVGRYFMEHPRLVTGILLPTNPRTSVGLYSQHRTLRGEILEGHVALSEQTLRQEQILDVQMDLDPIFDPAYMSCVDALDSENVTSLRTLLRAFRSRTIPNDFQRHLANVLNDLSAWTDHAVTAAPIPLPKPELISEVWQADPAERVAFLCEWFGTIAPAAYEEILEGFPLEHINVTTRIEQAPNPDSRVTLGPERDRLGLNRVQLNWQLTPLDQRSMIRALEVLGMETGSAGIGRVQITLAEDDGWPETLRGGWHLMGTTRMSDDPRKGVVDRNCQVHGISNLFIAGSSVFPTAGSAPPTLTLVSLAIRLADHLKERMG